MGGSSCKTKGIKMVTAGPLSVAGELAGARMIQQMNQGPVGAAGDSLKKLSDAPDHERTARKHEGEVHQLAKEYAFLQRKKSITDADYPTESKFLAREYLGHLERRLRPAAYDAVLSRKDGSEYRQFDVERQMFARDLQRAAVGPNRLLHTLPEGGYVAPIFTRSPALP